MILAYSAKKIKANPPPPYSTLNPETNSDSPSAKSKGVRLVSAKLEIIHINPIGKNKKINHKLTWNNSKYNKLKLPNKSNKENNIKTKATSYEIVWAIARNEPSKAYIEFDDHPAIITI